MGERFEDLTRTLGGTTSRRQALKMFGAAAAAAVATSILKPFRAQGQPANCVGKTPCGEQCCPAGLACINAAKSQCGCPAGFTQCGPTTCCSPGVGCRDAAKGTCGCAPGAQTCGKGCCKEGQTCSDPKSTCCCDSGTTPCGPACCASGVGCANYAKGTCGCPSGYTQCIKNGVVSCCPAGKACGNAACVPAESLGVTAKTCGSSHPECVGATCGNFKQCSSSSQDCVCFSTSTGGGICFPGSTFCSDLTPCGTGNSCAGTATCVLNSCCGYPICVPASLAALCPAGPLCKSSGQSCTSNTQCCSGICSSNSCTSGT